MISLRLLTPKQALSTMLPLPRLLQKQYFAQPKKSVFASSRFIRGNYVSLQSNPSVTVATRVHKFICFSFPSCWISRSLHNKLRLGTGSSSSLTDLSQAKSSSGGGEKGGTAGGLSEECGRNKETQQRRAGANATWNRSAHLIFVMFTLTLTCVKLYLQRGSKEASIGS